MPPIQPGDGEEEDQQRQQQRYPCPISDCAHVLTTRQSLRTHIQLHGRPKAGYLCAWDSCRLAFASFTGLEQHVDAVHLGLFSRRPGSQSNSQPISRPVSAPRKRPQPATNYVQERVLASIPVRKPSYNHEEYETYEDEEPEEVLHSPTSAKRPMNDKPAPCPYAGCGLSFRKAALYYHIQVAHKKIRYACLAPDCGKICTLKCDLKKHFHSQHPTLDWDEVGCQKAQDGDEDPLDPIEAAVAKTTYSRNIDLDRSTKSLVTKATPPKIKQNTFSHNGKSYTYELVDEEEISISTLSDLTSDDDSHPDGFKQDAMNRKPVQANNQINISNNNLSNLVQSEANIPCPYAGCPNVYRHQRSVDYHVETVHQGIRYVCPLTGCGLSYSRKTYLYQHLRQCHPGREIPGRGGGEEFAQRVALPPGGGDGGNDHAIVNTQNARTQRGLSISATASRNASIKMTVNSYIQQTGSASSNATRHAVPKYSKGVAATHTQAKPDLNPYKCTHRGCDREYRIPESLKAHLRDFHVGVRYRCPAPNCEKTYTRRYDCMTHVQRVHQEWQRANPPVNLSPIKLE